MLVKVAGGTNAGCKHHLRDVPKDDWTCVFGHLNLGRWASCMTAGCREKRRCNLA